MCCYVCYGYLENLYVDYLLYLFLVLFPIIAELVHPRFSSPTVASVELNNDACTPDIDLNDILLRSINQLCWHTCIHTRTHTQIHAHVHRLYTKAKTYGP